MEQTILFVLLGAVIFGFGAILFVLNNKLKELKNQSAVEMVKSDITELSRGINNLQQVVGDKIERNNISMQSSMQKQLSELSLIHI